MVSFTGFLRLVSDSFIKAVSLSTQNVLRRHGAKTPAPGVRSDDTTYEDSAHIEKKPPVHDYELHKDDLSSPAYEEEDSAAELPPAYDDIEFQEYVIALEGSK